jgi:selenocysteine lyase/cysteine desulfurase
MTEAYFKPFRDQIIGIEQTFPTPQGQKKMIYADWVASGRLYKPIEEMMQKHIAPFCANTHTETSMTSSLMTKAYHEAKLYIKKEVNASENDVLIFSGSGMTDSINKLQRIMGLRIPEKSKHYSKSNDLAPSNHLPVVFVTHLEHHSNHTSWLETVADVEIIQANDSGNVDLKHLESLLIQYADRPLKIASVSAGSNVTGMITPYHEIAEIMHAHQGYCFVDFACTAPYVNINMHPEKKQQYLDAIFISPHKFLGGPGTPGIMIIHKEFCNNAVPDHAGGGTVKFTTPWKTHTYLDNIEDREDGGTPPFLQGIRAALCFKLKKEMGVENILGREAHLIDQVFEALEDVENLVILEKRNKHRIGAISFYIEGLHFNLAVRLFNDYFGIQVRGGCACAGTYGHYLLNINKQQSDEILAALSRGELMARPGWVRLSLHPTITDAELSEIIHAIKYIAANHQTMAENYEYISKKNIFEHKSGSKEYENQFVEALFA